MADAYIGSRAELEAQLVVEVFVSELERSVEFYRALGFEVERRTSGLAALRWEAAYKDFSMGGFTRGATRSETGSKTSTRAGSHAHRAP